MEGGQRFGEDATLAAIEAAGFEGIEARCRKRVLLMQFAYLRRQGVTMQTTLAQLRARARCRQCGARYDLARFRPYRAPPPIRVY